MPKEFGKRRAISVRAISRWTTRLLLSACAVLVAAAIVVVVVIPRMTQGSALTVLTGSMSPEIPVGSVVMVRPVDPATLEVGDIATYQVEPDREVFITHRVTEIHEGPKGLSFTFKGDANRGADLDRIPSDAVRGEVWFHVPYLGSIRDGLHGQGGITLVAMILLVGYALTQFSGFAKDRRGAKDGTTTGVVSLGRPVVLARLSTAPDESATDLARSWGGLLVAQDDDTVTLLIAPPEDGLAAALELLASQHPLHVEVWDADAVLTGTSRRVEHRSPESDAAVGDHATG